MTRTVPRWVKLALFPSPHLTVPSFPRPEQLCAPLDSSMPVPLKNHNEVLRCFTVLGERISLVPGGALPPIAHGLAVAGPVGWALQQLFSRRASSRSGLVLTSVKVDSGGHSCL